MLWVSYPKLICNHSGRLRPFPAEFHFFFNFKKSTFSVVYQYVPNSPQLRQFSKSLDLLAYRTIFTMFKFRFNYIMVYVQGCRRYVNYESGYTMTGQREELILIVAYDLCHPNWSEGVIRQEIRREHNIDVRFVSKHIVDVSQ